MDDTDMSILKIHPWQFGMLSPKLYQSLNAISQFFVLKEIHSLSQHSEYHYLFQRCSSGFSEILRL
jgi:hypothetical protein